MSTKVDFVLTWLRSASDNDASWPVDPSEAVALIEEIERLRDEVAMLQQEARIRKNLCDGLASEADAERAAVVAWLRGGAGLRGGEPAEEWDDLWVAARDIERGEHRREEKP